MVGLEFETSGPAACPAGVAAAVSQACLARGMLLLTTSVFETLRFIPPLTVTAGEIDEALGIFAAALEDVLGPPGRATS